jgi:hypothetical protein
MSPLANPGRKADLEQRARTSTHTVSILRGYVTPMEMEPIAKEVAEDFKKSIGENTIVSTIEKYEDYCGRVVPERYSTLVTSESRKAYQRMMGDFSDTRRESPLMATLGYLLGSPTLLPELSPLGPFDGMHGKTKLIAIIMIPFFVVLACAMPVFIALNMRKKRRRVYEIALYVFACEISFIATAVFFLSWALAL